MPADPNRIQTPAPTGDDYRLLVDSVQDYAIFLLDTQGRVASWNLGAAKIKGYSASEIIGQHFSRFYPPDTVLPYTPDEELAIAREQGRLEVEGWRLRKDGTRFWASVVITALWDEHRVLKGYAKVTRDLTDHRNVEDELRHSEERFRLLVEAVVDYAIYMLDPEGRVTTWNSGAEAIKGYTPDEVIGRHFSIFFTAEDASVGKPEAELEVARNQGRFEEEGWRVKKDGSRFWASVTVTSVRGAQGELLGFAKVTRDLTARRQAEETARELVRQRAARTAAEESQAALRESHERYQALSRRLEVILEGMPDGVTVQNRAGDLMFANSTAAAACGFASVAELLEAGPAEVFSRFELLDEQGNTVDPESLPGRQVLLGAPGASMLVRVRDRASGRDWWSRIRASAIVGPDGKPELAVNVWHDVTSERRREEHERCLVDATAALSSSLDHETMLSTLAELLVPRLTDWCAIHLVEGDRLKTIALAHTNPEDVAPARELERRFPPDPRGKSGLWNVIRSGAPELYSEITDEMLQQHAKDPEHLELLRRLGAKSALTVPISIRSQTVGTITLVSVDPARRYDVQDIALVEELARRAASSVENSRLYEAAQESAKRAEMALRRAEEASRIKDEFLATVSHELRTPLQSIVGWSTLLRERNMDASVAKGIEVIHRNAQAQGKLVEDILDVSRVITGKLRLELKSTDLAAIVSDAVEVVRASALAKQIEIDVVRNGGQTRLVADPERLQQVVWNLLSNAVKFTDPGGTITVEAQQTRSKLVLTVKDTGRGIEPEFLPYVFDRFKQADSSTTRRVGGLGLGLAIVRHIVELHGGQVQALSEGLGKGSTFLITLPIRAVAISPEARAEPATRAVDLAQQRTTVSLDGVRVLVVDDEEDARDLLEIVLRAAGAQVQAAASAGEGLEHLEHFRPHVLVSDIGMPDVDGYAFMRTVRELDTRVGGGVPSIALTAYTRAEEKIKAISAGFTTHVGKPVNPDDLLAAVANLARLSPRLHEN